MADLNETHMFNPNWPPHAKFHNAQTIMLGTLLGLIVLWLVWFNKNYNNVKTIQMTIILASFYWIAQVGAYFFPETALVDPEFRKPGEAPAQLILCSVIFMFLIVAYSLEKNRIKSNTRAISQIN